MENREKIKMVKEKANLLLRKIDKTKLAALVTSGVIFMTSNALTVKAKAETVKDTAMVNSDATSLRLDNDDEGYVLGQLKAGDIVDRLACDGEWDLVSVNGKLGFVAHSYLQNYAENNNITYSYAENKDLVITTSEVNFRSMPTTNGNTPLSVVPANYELETLAIVNDDWFMVKFDGQIGFVSRKYTDSLKGRIQQCSPNLTDVEIKYVGYAVRNTTLFNSVSQMNVDKYQTFKIVDENNEYYLVSYQGNVGYVSKKDIELINGKCVVVDISDQTLELYDGDNLIQNTLVSTGSQGNDTPLGVYSIKGKYKDYYMPTAKVHVNNWLPYNGNYGFHDATWQTQPFGVRRSHGCTRMPLEEANELYDNVSKGDKVLNKK